MVCNLRLGGQVGWRVVIGGDELCMFVFMELVGPRLQHTLLQINTPLELNVPERTERHEQAQQPVLNTTESGKQKEWRKLQ